TSEPALPGATHNVLLNFRRQPSNLQARWNKLVVKRERREQSYSETLAKLRQSLREDRDPRDLKGLLLLLFHKRYRRPSLPSPTDLLNLAWHFYPPRGDLAVHVY